VRSSWLTSDVKRRCAANPRSSRSSLVFLGIGVGQDALIQRAGFDARGLRGDFGDRTNSGRREVPRAHQSRRGSRHNDGHEHQ